MPKYRKLHTQIIESQDVQDMPDDFTRLVWVLLPLGLDREGRCVDNISLVKSKIMPMRDDVTPEMIAKAIDWFVDRGMIVRYGVNGRRYFYSVNFHKFQGNTSKEAESILPSPGETPEPIEKHSGVSPELVQSKSTTDAIFNIQYADADADTKIAAQKPPPDDNHEPKRESTGQQIMFGVVAEVCVMDPKLHGTRIGKVAKRLCEYPPDLVKQWYSPGGWWYMHDWRGQKGQPPGPEQIVETVKRAQQDAPKAHGPPEKRRVVWMDPDTNRPAEMEITP